MSAPPPAGSPCRLVIFDWDGTLVDSVSAIVACTNAMLEELGFERAPEATIRTMIGGGLIESVRAFAPPDDDGLYPRIVEAYTRLWFSDYHDRSDLFEGARELLAGLDERSYLLGIATAKSRRGLSADIDRLGLDGLFHATRTADDTPAKPHPAMLEEILDELGVAPAEALMVGDTTHDVRMGHNARVPVIAVSSGADSRETLQALGPRARLDSVAELAGWLRRAS